MGVSKLAVQSIIGKYKARGSTSLQRKRNCRRKLLLSSREKRMILTASRMNPRKLPNEIKQDLNIPASSRTVRRVLFEGGRKAFKPVKKQLLTQTMKKKRLAWAHQDKDWTVDDWKKVFLSIFMQYMLFLNVPFYFQVIYTDESHFHVQGQQMYIV